MKGELVDTPVACEMAEEARMQSGPIRTSEHDALHLSLMMPRNSYRECATEWLGFVLCYQELFVASKVLPSLRLP